MVFYGSMFVHIVGDCLASSNKVTFNSDRLINRCMLQYLTNTAIFFLIIYILFFQKSIPKQNFFKLFFLFSIRNMLELCLITNTSKHQTFKTVNIPSVELITKFIQITLQEL